jgi:hypothetical protein
MGRKTDLMICIMKITHLIYTFEWVLLFKSAIEMKLLEFCFINSQYM